MKLDLVHLISDLPQDQIEPCVTCLEQSGFRVRVCQSVAVLCDQYDSLYPTCILTMMQVRELFGVEIHRTLQMKNILAPVIILSYFADIPMAVAAIKQGVFDVLPCPSSESDLKEAVTEAISSDAKRLKIKVAREDLQVKLESLTPREVETLQHVVNGLSSSQIAYQFSRSEKTVKLHRAHIMKKLAFESAHELVQQLIKLKFDLDDIAQSCIAQR